MKNQVLFSSKDKSKKIKMSSAAVFVLRFKGQIFMFFFLLIILQNITKYHDDLFKRKYL